MLYDNKSGGVAVRAFRLTAIQSVITVNVRENVTLRWTYEVSRGERYTITWGTSADLLFTQKPWQKTAQPSPKMPTKYANRVKIVGKASLFIQRVDLSDDGFYNCHIQGDFVSLRKDINLTVIDPPRILTQLPLELTWIEGDRQEINCDADGKPKPRVTWHKDGSVIKSGHRRAKLEFTSVSYKDEGSYKYVPKETNITTNLPQDTVDDGSVITITCEALGNPPPSYKLFINDKPILDKQFERSGILTITAIGFKQKGIYRCRPENDRGTGPISEVAVYVRITHPPGNKIVDENNPVGVRCEAEGYPRPLIKWVKLLGNKNVANGTDWLLRSAQRTDQGRYRCIATNGFGRDAFAEFEINVYFAPVINRTASSQDVPAWAGIPTNLSCVATANPAPRYEWTKASGVVATSEKSGWLRVTPQEGDGFEPYTCTVENNKGSDSMVIRLVKVGMPVVKLKVVRRQSDSLFLEWLLLSDGATNSFISHYTLQYHTDHSNGGIERTIQISSEKTNYQLHDLQPYTKYTIELFATNKHFSSETSKVEAMTTEAAPSPPRNVKVKIINGTAVNVKWEAPLRPNGPLLFYTVSYDKKEYIPNGGTKILSVLPNITEVVIAPSEPLAFEANMTGAHSATLRWRKPRQLNGKILLFKIRMRWRYKNVKGTYRFITKKIPAKVTPRERRRLRRHMMDYRVLRLEPVREIQLTRIQPFAFISVHVSEGTGITDNEVFWSPWSNNYTVQTLEGELKQNKGASVKVTWLPPEYPNGIIQKYRIVYRNNSIKNYTAEVTKGLKNTSLFYILLGLHKDSIYQINVQAFTSFPGEMSPTVRRDIKTPGDVLEQSKVDTASLYGGVFAGIIAFVFVIIIVALVIRNHRKRRDATDLSGKQHAVANSNDSGIGDKESLDHVPGVKCVQGVRRGSEDVIGPGKFVTIKPIPIQRLPEYCAINHADRNKGFREEFLSIRVPGSFTWENSQKPENKAKNRFNNIIPYDHTRVTLTELEGSPGSDYINANFIDGYDHPCKFIATQGPVANTFGDFWRTVWEQGVCVVIMVTNIVEGGRIKCLKYWPSASPEMYGLVLVSPQGEEELADYVVRKFSIQMISKSAEHSAREVTQYHFTAWPDQGVPTHATSLLAFLRKVRTSVPEDSGPILIHCSAGVGRTGTYIVLDAMLDQIAAEGVVDIYGFISHIRQQRSFMVQTEGQYIFVHNALEEYVTCGSTEFPVSDLPERLRILNTVDPDSGDSLVVAEFKGQCAYYLPRREEFIVYGLLMVEVETEDQRNGFCRRRLRVTNTKSGEIRSIYHFHFKEWAERSIPLNGMGLLDMMKCITRVQQQTGNGPIVIHCSDGSGRTGTFCAINVALERVKLDGTIDIFQTVRRLRTQRPLMVQTEEQYKLCYEITRLFVESFNDYSNLK
ncbi:Receptor-type tyrosine-protein phosphatase delta [Acropora cervicornis]|uniref:protein-tyrosine-phosphatase n=1 Tax=Acropora cervicornis TaxID=6130 RepID=A0AAD9Q620_ACRCE|nr:Receptor-type tyrosine-protein phosphatase delta [Acropora cervicornis]